jgi:hypothetical protein
MTDGGEGMLGNIPNSETRKKLSLSKSGNKNPKFKGKIVAINKKTGKEMIFTGNKELESFGFDNGHVYHCVNGVRKSHKGHIFKRVA